MTDQPLDDEDILTTETENVYPNITCVPEEIIPKLEKKQDLTNDMDVDVVMEATGNDDIRDVDGNKSISTTVDKTNTEAFQCRQQIGSKVEKSLDKIQETITPPELLPGSLLPAEYPPIQTSPLEECSSEKNESKGLSGGLDRLSVLSEGNSHEDNLAEGTGDPDPWSVKLTADEKAEPREREKKSTKEEQSLGAKILIDRFSSWRQIAKETVSTNAQTIMQSKVGQQLATRANATTKTLNETTKTFFANKPNNSQSVSSSDEGDLSSSFEEEGTATESDRLDDGSVDSNASSNVTTSDPLAASGLAAAVAVRSAANAATSVAESVATGFRGRYTGDIQEVQRPQHGTQSQTALILQSRAASHMQGLLDTLDHSHEYVMLLGHGMLGVNLKQSFLRNHGVYIDYLINEGHAHKSSVVHVGDTIMKVADLDVTRGTIFNIPQTIAGTKRPVVLVFSTGQKTTLDRVNYIDVAIAMMHQIRDDQSKSRHIACMPLHDGDHFDVKTKKSPQVDDNENAAIDWFVPDHSLDKANPSNIPPLTIEVKASLSQHLPKRGCDKFSLSMMLQAATSLKNFNIILKYAFITCAMDGRRLPFLSAQYSSENSIEGEQYKSNQDSQKTTSSTHLMLFLELMSFVELYDATPLDRRRDLAKKIAYKFFLPTRIGNKMEQPMFDFTHIVPKADLNALVMAINDKNTTISRSLFLAFQNATVDSLAGAPFLTFLMSHNCARMRGYLRNTSPFQTVSPTAIFDAVARNDTHHAHNHFIFILMYLLCQRERDIGGENDDIMPEKTGRVFGAAGGLCCAMFVLKRLRKQFEVAVPLVCSTSAKIWDSELSAALLTALEQLWESFVSPQSGALDTIPHSNETDDSLSIVRTMMKEAALLDKAKVFPHLVNSNFLTALDRLAMDLIYDYVVNTYPKFKEHKFHEWLCSELSNEGLLNHTSGQIVPPMATGSVKRLLRKAQLPSGLSAHRPIRGTPNGNSDLKASKPDNEGRTISDETLVSPFTELPTYPNAQVAVVFGSDDGIDAERVPNPAMDHYDIRRYISEAVELDGISAKSHSRCQIPPTLESYATLPLRRITPFSNLADPGRVSSDGWEISLLNFMIPCAKTLKGENTAIYGVSLVFQRKDLVGIGNTDEEHPRIKLIFDAKPEENVETPRKRRGEEFVYDNETGEAIDIGAFASPISFLSPENEGSCNDIGKASECTMKVSAETPTFNRRIGDVAWTTRIERHGALMTRKSPITVGVALVSSQNVILAMRSTLSRLFFDFSKSYGSNEALLKCTPLVELLGNFSHRDVERQSLKCILEPYLRYGLSPWLERPFKNQQAEYESSAGQHLIESLPPIPLGLIFVTMMLEQKIIISSSRRSSLFAVVSGIVQLLQPLKWAHLMVPLAPVALARDLLQYPAPFIIGLPSEDPGNMNLLNDLPDDVTLVDLDVGRVILAPSISFDDALLRNSEDRNTTGGALRSQILYLAQALGIMFGSKTRNQIWCSDSPLVTWSPTKIESKSGFEHVKNVCCNFLTELLAGTSSCCYWIEEAMPDDAKNSGETECTVLFDEDRFFNVKNLRVLNDIPPLFGKKSVDGLAVSLDDFDLIIECFLRCQSMSTYISSRPKGEMAFS